MTSIEEALRSGAVRLVPVEATDDMLAHGDEAMVDTIDTDNWLNHCRNAYNAMLSAAPDHTPALLALIEERDRLKVERDIHEGNANDNYQRWVKCHDQLRAAEAKCDALREATPEDGSCVRCGSVPRNTSGLCATCVDEDAERAGEAALAPSPDLSASLAEMIEGLVRERDEAQRLATEHVQARFHAEQREHSAHLAVKEERALVEAAEAERDALREALDAVVPYVDCIVCYASTMGEHEPNRIAHKVRAVCHGPSQDELVGRQIAAQMIAKIDAAASPPALAARSTEAWRDLDNARLQRAIDAFYEPCEGTTIDGIRNAILAWERG